MKGNDAYLLDATGHSCVFRAVVMLMQHIRAIMVRIK